MNNFNNKPIYFKDEVKHIFALDKLTDLYISLYGFALNSSLLEVKKEWKKLQTYLKTDHYSPSNLYYSSDPVRELRHHEDIIFNLKYSHFFDSKKLKRFAQMAQNLERAISGRFSKEELLKEEQRRMENLSLTSSSL